MADGAADVERAEETGAMLVHTDAQAADERLDLAARDPKLLEALVARHWAAAYHLALPLTGGDPAAAEDAAQDAFVRVLEHAGRFDPRRAFRPWLLRIVRNVALDQRRARVRRARHEARAPEASRTLAVDPALAEERARVQALVAGLPHDLRDALCVRYVGGLSLAEAAEALECPEGTVSSRVRRGLEALREALGPAAASLVPDALGAIRELAVPPAPALEGLRAGVAATTAASGAAKAAVATAPLRLALAAVPLLLVAAGGAAALLRPEEAPPPVQAAVVAAAPASLEVVAPAGLAVGDRALVVLRGPGEAPTVQGTGGLAVAAPSREGDVWTVAVTAERPGPALLLAARPGADEVRASVHVRPRLVGARVVGNVELEGPEAAASVALEPRARLLRGPRAVHVRLLPGLAAEVALSLQGFARAPTGCFEQTTAATYPSALVLELAQGAERPDGALVEHARACAAAGAERLLRFQEPDGSFSVYGDGRRDPWITAVGLGELVHLARVVPVERSRIDRAADALLRWRGPDGRFAPGERTAGRELAHTAYCAWALLVAGRPAADVEPSLAWLEARLAARGALPAYDLAHAARALLLDPTRAAAARAALDALAEKARVAPDVAPWEPTPTLTGSSAGAVETAALAAQVLLGSDHAALAERALTWLAAQRVDGGFGGRGERLDTQATVQALEAFRRGATSRRAARGRLVLGGGAGRAIDVESPALVEHELVARGADEAAVDALLARGLSLRWSGVGRLSVQLVVEGEVEPGSSLLADAEEARLVGLRVRVDRPLVGQVGEPQRWTVQVTNDGAAPVVAPMVELELPGGFELAGEDGGLGALREQGRLALFERRDDGLALYLHDLAPGARLVVPFVVVPAVAGEFASGTLRAYPYYGPRRGVVVASEAVAVAPAGASGPRYRSPPPPERPRAAPARAPSAAAPSATPAVRDEPDAEPAPGSVTKHHRVGVEFVRGDRDDRLRRAPTELTRAPVQGAGDPLAGLLGPLLQGDVVQMSQVRRAGRWVELFLDRERAVDAAGRPIDADTVAAAWAAALRDLGALRPTTPVAWEQLRLLAGMKVEVLTTWSLRVLPPDGVEDAQLRLSAWPFRVGPFPPAPGSELPVSAGPYRLARCDKDGLLLVRRAEKGREPPAILVERLDPDARQRPDATVPRTPPLTSPLGLRLGAPFRARLGEGLPGLRALFGDDPVAAAAVRLQGTVRLAHSGPDDRAEAVRRRLEQAGATVELVSGHGFDLEPDLYLGLLVGREEAERGVVLARPTAAQQAQRR